MYRIRRKTIVRSLPVLLLVAAMAMIWLGVPSVTFLRTEPYWPLVPLVSVPPGTTQDILSSAPGGLHVFLASLQGILLVEMARLFWVAAKELTVSRFMLTLIYEVTLVVDMFRLWGKDWLVWALYQLNLGRLCDPAHPCYPVSGATPWLSLSLLVLILLSLVPLSANRAQS